METNPALGVAIPDADYDRILDILKTKNSIKLTNKDKIEKKFYLKNGILYADSWADTTKITEEVFKQSEIAQQYSNTFRESVRQRMVRDHPEWSTEEIEANADIVNEANETIKRLIQSGVDFATAVGVVKHTLTSDSIDEEVKNIEMLMASNPHWFIA